MDLLPDTESIASALEGVISSCQEKERDEWRRLIRALDTPDPALRLGIARTLCQAGSEIVPWRGEAGERGASERREAVLTVLGMMGRRAAAAAPAVRALCDDPV